MEWIKTSEQMPPDDTRVLCCYMTEDGASYAVMEWHTVMEGWIGDDTFDYDIPDYWMPLPEQPQRLGQ